MVIDPEVVEYGFNKFYIIAKSIQGNNEKYWIINKQLPIDNIESLQKTQFLTELSALNIDLKLIKRK